MIWANAPEKHIMTFLIKKRMNTELFIDITQAPSLICEQ